LRVALRFSENSDDLRREIAKMWLLAIELRA
jgi:hypothetical protein